MVGRQRDEFLLSSGLQLLGGVKDMIQRKVAGLQVADWLWTMNPDLAAFLLLPPLVCLDS